MDLHLVGPEQGRPHSGKVAEMTLQLLLQVQRLDVLVEGVPRLGGVRAVLALVPLGHRLPRVSALHVRHQGIVAQPDELAQLAPEWEFNAGVNTSRR